jgi:ribonuclease HII
MDTSYEKQKHKKGYLHVIGCDEVGRGSLAGPVVAAAVVLDFRLEISDLIKRGIKDSKLLLPKKREELSGAIKQYSVAWGIGAVEPAVIDEINIHHATLLAMKMAVENLLQSVSCESELPPSQNFFLCLDGKFAIPDCGLRQEAVVDGDNKILSVAAASIIAKVYRDNLMRELHKQYPDYNFEQHKGYGTLHHRKMIIKHGLSAVHRSSFCKNLAA